TLNYLVTLFFHTSIPLSSLSILQSDLSLHCLLSSDDHNGMCGLSELVSSCLSASKSSRDSSPDQRTTKDNTESIGDTGSSNGSTEKTQPFFRCSQFSNVPPTVRFYTKGTKVTKPNRKICSRLTWCHNSLLPIVMRHSLAASHFKVVEETNQWIGYWGRHLKSTDYRNILPHQKVNHYPGAFHIGRKDRLWTHVSEQIDRFGSTEYGIVPYTYILPREMESLEEYLEENPEAHVIIKPPASARGTGIMVTRKMKDIKQDSPLIAQQYIYRPMTINGTKFDLRLYAYVPCLDPLRVYLYEEGLVRFATVKYSNSMSTISNKYMHLTNYSINKFADRDGISSDPVPKWRLSELWTYFEERGIDSKKILESIEEVIVKAFIACEKHIRDHMLKQIHSGYVCHELFGFDILLDEKARPWLLEVNISPSLHSGTPLDSSVKAPLAKDVLNMAGIYINNGPVEQFKTSSIYMSRPRKWPKSSRQLEKEDECRNAYAGEGSPSSRLTARLTPEDVRLLVEFEDEMDRKGDFRLLFPTKDTVKYMKYFIDVPYGTLLLQRWQLEQKRGRTEGVARLERLCREGIVLQEDIDSSDSEVSDHSSDDDGEDEDSEEEV
ncbi:ttll-4, partial [Pristionchus pacificus]|uniref:Ttll-4 n=1 Tax=Pristionchus pacificus TaxID=54126 RepID=A0A2A6B496_PRIPA